MADGRWLFVRLKLTTISRLKACCIFVIGPRLSAIGPRPSAAGHRPSAIGHPPSANRHRKLIPSSNPGKGFFSRFDLLLLFLPVSK
jgi:hypothetical protein